MDVGPDISDTRTKTTAMLLADILNPNLAIDNNYINYIVHLKNGITKTGMIKATNAVSITLVRAEKQSEVIPQDQIEELQSTGQSLMPDGIENGNRGGDDRPASLPQGLALFRRQNAPVSITVHH